MGLLYVLMRLFLVFGCCAGARAVYFYSANHRQSSKAETIETAADYCRPRGFADVAPAFHSISCGAAEEEGDNRY